MLIFLRTYEYIFVFIENILFILREHEQKGYIKT